MLGRLGLLRLSCIVAALLSVVMLGGCVGAETKEVIFTAMGQTTPVEFTIGTKNTAGNYEIVSQTITAGVGDFELVEASNVPAACKGQFAVQNKVPFKCPAKVKALNNNPAEGELRTVWREVGFLEKTNFTTLKR